MNEKDYINSQKECASLIGQSFFQYNNDLKKIKRSVFNKNTSTKEKTTDLLSKLGLSKKDLKKKVS